MLCGCLALLLACWAAPVSGIVMQSDVSLAEDSDVVSSSDNDDEPQVVWVYAFDRSGSGTMQDIISQLKNKKGNTFSLFEPCHIGDRVHMKSCRQEMSAMMNCDFSKVVRLDQWSILYPEIDYTPQIASTMCRDASIRIFKTTHMHNIREDALPLLKTVKNLKIIDLVRDPRGIFFAMKKKSMVEIAVTSQIPARVGLGLDRVLQPGKFFKSNATAYIQQLCSTMLSKAHLRHSSVLTVKFEDMLGDPLTEMNRIMPFLGYPMDTMSTSRRNRIETVVRSYFSVNLTPWKKTKLLSRVNHLYADDWDDWAKEEFNSATCRSAIKAFGYPKKPFDYQKKQNLKKEQT